MPEMTAREKEYLQQPPEVTLEDYWWSGATINVRVFVVLKSVGSFERTLHGIIPTVYEREVVERYLEHHGCRRRGRVTDMVRPGEPIERKGR